MTLYSGFFNSVNGDRKYDATWFAQYFASFIGNGVFPNPSTGVQVVEGGDMTTVIKDGKGWINGYYLVNKGDYVLQHDNADGVLKRIDRIVMRLNYLTRQIEIAIKKGTFANSPVAPTLQRDADAYELALADVLINNGATAITQANITDQRLNNELCGIVHGVVDQVDTATIFNQYQSWFEQMTGQKLNEYDAWFAQHQQEFNDWFITIQDILDGNVAGNLLTLININTTNIQSLIKTKTNITVLASGWILNSTTGYYEYVINDSDIMSASVVDVNIHLEYLELAMYVMSACTSDNGFFTLYANDIIEGDLIVDYRITRQVV